MYFFIDLYMHMDFVLYTIMERYLQSGLRREWASNSYTISRNSQWTACCMGKTGAAWEFLNLDPDFLAPWPLNGCRKGKLQTKGHTCQVLSIVIGTWYIFSSIFIVNHIAET